MNQLKPSSLWFHAALLPDGWARDVRLSIAADGTFAGVERDVASQPGEAIGSVALPGAANLHSHAFQRGMAGLSEISGNTADNFWSWREVMYQFLDTLTPDDVEAIAAMAQIEMLETGFTRVGEFHYLHHDPAGKAYGNLAELSDRIVGAAEMTGIGLTLLPVFYAHSDFGSKPPTHGQRRFITSLDQFAKLFDAASKSARSIPGGTVGVAPHSLRAVSPQELSEVIALCPQGPVHIHAAEQTKEVDDCLAATGTRPVQWLLDHAPVDEQWCIIHATHLDETETQQLAASAATVSLCPLTEANLGDGIFPMPAFLEHGGQFGVGTDSNIDISLPGELRMLEYAQRLSRRARNVVSRPGASTGRTLFDAAVSAGGRILTTGPVGLITGASADLVTLAADFPALTKREQGDTILDRFIFADASHAAIDEVFARGRRVVSQGRHVHRDAVHRNYRSTIEKALGRAPR